MKSPLPFLAVALLAVMISGCSGQPEPVTATPAFVSEEEAFAAAEQTYRNYVDALNKVDLSDPHTFRAVFDWTTGDANASARESFSQMYADKWKMSGHSVVTLIEHSTTQATPSTDISIAVCLDVSAITGVDKNGNSVVSPDRRPVQSMQVTLKPAASPTGLLLSTIDGREGAPLCAGS
ncbi:hypothetical protein [Microbacterium rhizomatis]|uniref:Nuclear transport factor 2 family protein n=1 Tax=Microbacterium rhizomatis TaxID=1631477 RepID=A0A5J5J0M7_9MICO|nr:hypothetical protein [Microbacterium rhizomatis]KAA9105499.1 hypothetical protein F6B43_17125 [Microbacterium rhizomatis]